MRNESVMVCCTYDPFLGCSCSLLFICRLCYTATGNLSSGTLLLLAVDFLRLLGLLRSGRAAFHLITLIALGTALLLSATRLLLTGLLDGDGVDNLLLCGWFGENYVIATISAY